MRCPVKPYILFVLETLNVSWISLFWNRFIKIYENSPSESVSTQFALFCFHLLNGLCYATRKLLTYVLQTFDFWRNALGQNFPKNTRLCLNISGFLINSSVGELIYRCKVIFAGEKCIFCQVWTWQNKPGKYVSLDPRL